MKTEAIAAVLGTLVEMNSSTEMEAVSHLTSCNGVERVVLAGAPKDPEGSLFFRGGAESGGFRDGAL